MFPVSLSLRDGEKQGFFIFYLKKAGSLNPLKY